MEAFIPSELNLKTLDQSNITQKLDPTHPYSCWYLGKLSKYSQN